MPAPDISPLPAAPQRTDVPSVFVSKADAFVASLAVFQAEMNAFGDYLDALALSGVTGPITGTALTVSTGKLLGRATAGTGPIEELGVGSGLSIIAGVLTATGGFTDEQAQDAIANLLQGNGITWTYDDASNTLTAKHTGVAPTTDATTARTASLADAGGWIEFTNASAVAWTIPPNSSTAFPLGTLIQGRQAGAGTVTITAGAGVTLNSRGGFVASAGQYAIFGVKKVATDTWAVIGDVA